MQGPTELPEMLVLDILSKLPAKSLTRFKCVSKSWSSSFQTPYFITQHHQNQLRNNNLNLLVKRCKGNTFDDICYFSQLSTEKGQNFSLKQNIFFPFVDYVTSEFRVHGPRNGILCLECEEIISLWNPSTREFRILPQSTIQRPSSSLDYTVRTDLGCVGFGYDSQTDDYKVMRFVNTSLYYDGDYGYTIFSHVTGQVDLYSLNANSWKEISDPEVIVRCSTVLDNYVNGVYYWPADRDNDNDVFILSFDMVNEKFSTLPSPKLDGGLAQYNLELFNYNGLLGAITYPREGNLDSFDLWVMSGSWTKQFSIEYVIGAERPLGLWRNGEFFFQKDYELLLFDPSTRELKYLGVHSYKESIQLISYVESLVRINGRSEHEERVVRQTAGRPFRSMLKMKMKMDRELKEKCKI
ncbi:hypothetical protein like AT3G06240 [Hibiscus trionum]|uniref:F-box domain-containing protein n=1 Tax=Hibiscus trionum TaxID=183268 RepID=A0A9W7JLE9_HIBTR|nr:hypothetical protein like AT3G06240 [Hibiscus trionum]